MARSHEKRSHGSRALPSQVLVDRRAHVWNVFLWRMAQVTMLDGGCSACTFRRKRRAKADLVGSLDPDALGPGSSCAQAHKHRLAKDGMHAVGPGSRSRQRMGGYLVLRVGPERSQASKFSWWLLDWLPSGLGYTHRARSLAMGNVGSGTEGER